MGGAKLIVAGCLLAVMAGCTAERPPVTLQESAASTNSYRQQVEQARRARVETLRAPEGWLSYVGSGLIRPGRHRIGRDRHNDIVLPDGPAQLGVVELDKQGRIWLDPAGDTGPHGATRPQRMELAMPPGQWRSQALDVGRGQFHVVRLGKIIGWRFRDPEAPARREFRGIEYFPVDPDWRIVAEWHPFEPPRPLTLLTSIATPRPARVPGEAVFERDGRRFRLLPVQDSDSDTLFFLFSDRTSGRETYGGARYLEAGKPQNGQVVLDFNRAENPPCAFTPHVVCPLAPPQNRLELSVTAGEKNHLAFH